MRNSSAHFAMALMSSGWILTQAAVADDGAISIVHLAMRDHVVTISSSPDGPRYSVRARSGTLLSENLTDRELLASYPQLYLRINSGFANEDSGSFIWAGRDEELIEPPVHSVVGGE